MSNSNDTNQRLPNTPIQKMMEDSQIDSTIGPLIGSIIIIVLIILGGLYFLSSMVLNKKTEIEVQKIQTQQADTYQIEQTAKQSTTDDVTSIESDLKSTNIDSLDIKLDKIDEEF